MGEKHITSIQKCTTKCVLELKNVKHERLMF